MRARARACVCVCAYASQTFDSERPSNHVEEQADKLQTKYAEEYKRRQQDLISAHKDEDQEETNIMSNASAQQ